MFTPKGLGTNIEAVEDFYGSKGYIDVTPGSRNLNVVRIPNTETGTMDLEFQIDEGQKSYIEKIEIRGNTKTKDKVIRRELAVSPGEVFDMVRVKLSKQRLEGLAVLREGRYPTRADRRADPQEPGGGRGGEEHRQSDLGAGSARWIRMVGFAELNQGNFDLFHPPTFTGGGQKFRLRVQIGHRAAGLCRLLHRAVVPGPQAALGVDLYYRDLAYQSLGNIYDEVRAGGQVSLTRALGSDFLIGSVSYTIEDVGILFNDKVRPPQIVTGSQPAGERAAELCRQSGQHAPDASAGKRLFPALESRLVHRV